MITAKLVGLIRTVGDGETVVLIQDLLIYPEYQGKVLVLCL